MSPLMEGIAVVCLQCQPIPLRDLWDGFNPSGVKAGHFVIFRGYIDESCDNDQKLFVMSCLMTTGSGWMKFERSWKLHLAAINRKLKKEGRPLISRYHASDCSGRHNEFEGWSHDERDAFVLGLFRIIKRVGAMHTVAFDVDLDELCEVFPEWAEDRIKTAYATLTRFLMTTIGGDFSHFRGHSKITLFHDRTASGGKYDPTILDAFNKQMADPHFPYQSNFTTIAPLAWQDCIALQPADLVAFEVFKNSQARMEARKSRRSFDALMNLEDFGIHHKSFPKKAMLELRVFMEERKGGI